MKTKLNAPEAHTIVQLHKKIDTYESFISTVHAMVFARKTDLNYLVFDGTEFTNEMNRIWRFVKEKINADKQ